VESCLSSDAVTVVCCCNTAHWLSVAEAHATAAQWPGVTAVNLVNANNKPTLRKCGHNVAAINTRPQIKRQLFDIILLLENDKGQGKRP